MAEIVSWNQVVQVSAAMQPSGDQPFAVEACAVVEGDGTDVTVRILAGRDATP